MNDDEDKHGVGGIGGGGGGGDGKGGGGGGEAPPPLPRSGLRLAVVFNPSEVGGEEEAAAAAAASATVMSWDLPAVFEAVGSRSPDKVNVVCAGG